MNRGAWIIILLTIVAATLAVFGMVFLAYHGEPSLRGNVPKADKSISPPSTKVSDERILQLEVQLNDPDPEMRLDAIVILSSLAENDSERLGPVLIKALDNDDPQVRATAAMGLGSVAYASAATQLAALLDDPSKRVRLEGDRALVQLGQDGLRTVMQNLADGKLKNTDAGLLVVTKITGRSFGLGQRGRAAALEFWTEQSRQSR